jgi:8-oxo-dGTP pyrophosphatase MutT (NUDIX family)
LKVSFTGVRKLVRTEEADKPQAGAIIIKGEGDDRRILLVTNKGNDRWLFPKGTVKKKEFSEEAAEREAAEESGVHGEVVAYVGSTESEDSDEIVRVDYFLLVAVGENDMEEDRRRHWCKPDEVLQRIETPEIRALLKRALPEIIAFQVEEE